MSVHVMGDWYEIGNGTGQFFRKSEMYLMEWKSINVDLENYMLVGCSYGGPIALIRDDKKFTRITQSNPVKPIITIYNASGTIINAFKWDYGTLIKMDWTSTEDLICIQEDGNILVYSIFGILKDTINCLKTFAQKQKIYEAEIFHSMNGTGVAYLTTKQEFLVINNYKEKKIRYYSDVPGEGPFSSWCVISTSKDTKILAARDSNLYLVDSSGFTKEELHFSYDTLQTIIYMSSSLNGEHLALYTENGVVWMGSSNFITKYTEIQTSINVCPKQIVWCGKEAILISWDSLPTLLLVDRNGNKHTFPMDSKFYLIPDIDSARLVTNYTHEIIQKIPEDTRLIFGIGSLAPGSWLVEAYKEYTKKTIKADEYIRCISNMEEAVRQCISAAGWEFHPENQKLLLRAALFGKTWLSRYNADTYIHMCEMLRVINSVKDFKYSIPLTLIQLETMTIPTLVDRLLLRRNYALALEISKYVHLENSIGKTRILAHWASYKVEQLHVEDGRLSQEIHSKLKDDHGISYNEIAEKCYKLGRRKLALALAQHEIRKDIQVELFLKLKDPWMALEKAVESADSNLIYSCLFKIRPEIPLAEFQMHVRKFPAAYSLYVNYCKISMIEAARRIIEVEDDFPAQAQLFLEESESEKRLERRLSALVSAAQLFAKAERASIGTTGVSASKDYKKGKYDFMSSAIEERIRLLKEQQNLETKFGDSFLNLSLRETLTKLLKRKEVKMSEKLRSEFKVGDRVFWLIRINCLGEAQDWAELEKLSKPKKIPGGYEDFVEACLHYGNKEEAIKYLPKVKEDLQAKYYVEAGYYEKAAQIALSQKDEGMLEYTLSQCIGVDKELASNIEQMLESVRTSNQNVSTVRIW